MITDFTLQKITSDNSVPNSRSSSLVTSWTCGNTLTISRIPLLSWTDVCRFWHNRSCSQAVCFHFLFHRLHQRGLWSPADADIFCTFCEDADIFNLFCADAVEIWERCAGKIFSVHSKLYNLKSLGTRLDQWTLSLYIYGTLTPSH